MRNEHKKDNDSDGLQNWRTLLVMVDDHHGQLRQGIQCLVLNRAMHPLLVEIPIHPMDTKRRICQLMLATECGHKDSKSYLCRFRIGLLYRLMQRVIATFRNEITAYLVLMIVELEIF